MTAPFEIEEQDAPEVDLALRARERSEEPPVVCFPLRIDWELAGGAQEERRVHPEPEEVGEWVRELQDVPSAVLKLAERAREASWEVRAQYAVGTGQHARTGRPTSRRESYGLGFGLHPLTDLQAVAVYARSGKGSWGWESLWIWGPSRPHLRIRLLADLVVWLEAGGQVEELWCEHVAAEAIHHERETKARAKARGSAGGGKTKENGG